MSDTIVSDTFLHANSYLYSINFEYEIHNHHSRGIILGQGKIVPTYKFISLCNKSYIRSMDKPVRF